MHLSPAQGAAPRPELPSARTLLLPPKGRFARSVALDIPTGPARIWPFTSPVPARAKPSDPINVVFAGPNRDPRRVRGALLALEPQRPGFPREAPFDQRWTDAMGAVQTAFSERSGWSGSVIQLELGSYDSLRVHLRLFDCGDLTIGNVHVDILPPGMAEHQVVAWDAALDLVRYDLQRSGALACAPTESAVLSPSPFRSVPVEVLDLVPPGLVGWLGLPEPGEASAVELPNRGKAWIFELAPSTAPRPGVWTQSVELPIDCLVLKPFCRVREEDLVHLRGTVRLDHRVIQGSARFDTSFTAQGLFEVTPMAGSATVGLPYAARVSERYLGAISDSGNRSSALREHTEFQPTGGDARLATVRLLVGTGLEPSYSVVETL